MLGFKLYFASRSVVGRLRDRVLSRAPWSARGSGAEPTPPLRDFAGPAHPDPPLDTARYMAGVNEAREYVDGRGWVLASDLYHHLRRNVAFWTADVVATIPPDPDPDPPLMPSDVYALMGEREFSEHTRLPQLTGEEVLNLLSLEDFRWLESVCRSQLEVPGGVRMLLINGGFRVKSNEAGTHYIDVLTLHPWRWQVVETPMWFPAIYDRGWTYGPSVESAFRNAMMAAIDWNGAKETEPAFFQKRNGLTREPEERADG